MIQHSMYGYAVCTNCTSYTVQAYHCTHCAYLFINAAVSVVLRC